MMGKLFGLDDLHISLAAEPIVNLGLFSITNSTIMMVIGMVLVFFFLSRTAGRARLMPGGRWQNLGEAIVEGLLGLVQAVAGRSLARRIFPLVATLFVFILLSNWLALLPGVGSIGVCEQYHGAAGYAAEAKPGEKAATASPEAVKPAAGTQEETHNNTCPKGTKFVPLLRPANADLNMTLAMALVAVAYVQYIGVRFHGVGGYLKELATPPFLFPVHVISELSRVLSLSARLFGNIFGGEVFLVVIFFLFPLLLPLIPLGLELFFGLIQAILFSVLTLVYVTMAAAGHGGHGEEHGHAEQHAHHGKPDVAHAGD
jgi:F-type H+-transporting ATPase subunit a